MIPDDEYLTPREAAAIYRVSTRLILRLIHEGVLPATRVGRKVWRIKRSDLAAAFPSTTQTPPPPEPPPHRRRPTRGKG